MFTKNKHLNGDQGLWETTRQAPGGHRVDIGIRKCRWRGHTLGKLNRNTCIIAVESTGGKQAGDITQNAEKECGIRRERSPECARKKSPGQR